jgi:hypothetical protein
MTNTLIRPARLLLPAGVAARTNPRAKSWLEDKFLRARLGLDMAVTGGSSPLGGIHAESDIIRQTIDGFDTNALWAEFQAVLALLNAQRQPLVDLLTYTVTNDKERIPQVGNGTNFEKASEFGVPRAVRTGVAYWSMGFAFDDYDVGIRFTWKFLRDATAEQVRSVNDAITEADSRLVFGEVMRTLYSNVNRTAEITGENLNVYTFFNGDGMVPPNYRTNTFTAPHTHYLVSGGATVDSDDLDTVMTHMAHHGYSSSNGYTVVICVNVAEGDVIRNFRSVPNGGTAKYDFIPALGTPNFLLPVTLRVNDASGGQRPANTYRGMTVIGSYGDALILQDDYFAAGYVVGFATGGPENILNPIGIREHARPEWRGLHLLKGRSDDYPLQESYYGRSFGTGVRHRGAGVVMQIKASGSYAAPTQYA